VSIILTGISVALVQNFYLVECQQEVSILWTQYHNVLLTVFVNLLAQILGFLQLYTLSTTINHSTRILLKTRVTKLNFLEVWNAVTNYKPDWNLLPLALIFSLALSVLSFSPVYWMGSSHYSNRCFDERINFNSNRGLFLRSDRTILEQKLELI
jgi:hypothetical protein